MRTCLAIVSGLLLSLVAITASAQGLAFPANDGDRLECQALIEFPKGHVSGICVLQHDGDTINGVMVNEFGMTALDFRYLIAKDKVELANVAAMLDKWYIRRVLRKDLRLLLLGFKEGRTAYVNHRRHISYTLSPMDTDNHNTNQDEDID